MKFVKGWFCVQRLGRCRELLLRPGGGHDKFGGLSDRIAELFEFIIAEVFIGEDVDGWVLEREGGVRKEKSERVDHPTECRWEGQFGGVGGGGAKLARSSSN